MSISIASEKSLLSHDEFEAVKPTHHPAIASLALEVLQAAQRDLRQRRDKTRSISRQNRRRAQSRRGAREVAPAGEEAHAGKRKQVFAQALKRVNHELQRRQELAARATLMASAQRALELRRSKAAGPRPAAGQSAGEGMASKPSRRRTVKVAGSEVGRVSKATKAAQAKRDS
jgi:DnaJ-domain-containing protein 1